MDLQTSYDAVQIEKQIRQLEDQRISALAQSDFDILDELFEPRGIYCHSSGRVDNLEDYVRHLRAGVSRYTSPKYSIDSVRVNEKAAHVWGRFTTQVLRNGETIQLDVLAGVTWMQMGSTWKIVAVQTTRSQAS